MVASIHLENWTCLNWTCLSYPLSFLEFVPEVANKLNAPVTAARKFEEVVKPAQDPAVLVLDY